MADEEVRELFPPCKWEVEGESITFPVDDIQEDYGNRLVQHERAYRDGARLDDTGGKATMWRIVVSSYNTQEEPGVDDPTLQYPDLLNRLCDACKIHETGTLTTSTRGPRRCRAESYSRIDTADERDSARTEFIFAEDNEDDATQQDFQSPSASSVTRSAAEEGTAAAEAEGCGGFDPSDISEFASELEGLMSAPGDYVGDVQSKANAIASKVESVEETFQNTLEEAPDDLNQLLRQPGGALASRRFRKAADAAAKGAAEKSAAQDSKTRIVSYPRTVSIFDVASMVSQPSEKLISLNYGIEDLLSIRANTPIQVLDTQRVRNVSTT